MLIKEYRIPLPLTVDEYRIAQLYMIAKKSREESKGAGSGVEILVNEPYEDGPGGHGQYTHKIYHVGSHLPGWFKSLLPKSALSVEEKAWNAYPYTKTRYTCPFVEKFLLEIETYYFPDNGHQENVFKLSGSDLRNRQVDLIDVVKDQLYGADYCREEDPSLYMSEKTRRGPLTENWLDEYWNECKGKKMPLANGKSIMCAYKLCRVEFRYWGMQTKLEKFIHDVALRKTMVRAHRQAWAWQDEWHGLTMDDIREIERQTQEALKMTMSGGGDESGEPDSEDPDKAASSLAGGGSATPTNSNTAGKSLAATLGSIEKSENEPEMTSEQQQRGGGGSETDGGRAAGEGVGEISMRSGLSGDMRKRAWSRSSSKAQLLSPSSAHALNNNLDLATASWRMESIVRDSDDSAASGDEEEFFDCQDSISLAKWSSLDLLTEEDLDATSPTVVIDKQASPDDSIFSPSFLKRATSERSADRSGAAQGRSIDLSSCPGSPTSAHAQNQCTVTSLLLVLHGGSVLDPQVDLTAKTSDITTFRGAFECVMRMHYPSLVGRIAIRLVSCPSICSDGLSILSSLSPYSFDVSPSCNEQPHVTHDSIPIGAIPVLASVAPDYQEALGRTAHAANAVYAEFVKHKTTFTFIFFSTGDSVGSILAYDILCKTPDPKIETENNIAIDVEVASDERNIGQQDYSDMMKHLLAPQPRRRSSSTSEGKDIKLDFEVSELFMFGTPLPMVLAYRKIACPDEKNNPIVKPNIQQVYNLFHPTDPVASRMEPLISARFSILPPVNIPRHQKYPLGNGQPYHLLTQKWWGNKRLDYALYCPEGLANFPTNALPHLFHASYWESSDVIAFILRQLGRFDFIPNSDREEKDLSGFNPGQPREKWIRKRTSVKLKNVAANHRANDVIVREGAPQTLIARFMYGPLDMITLTGEKVDIHIMKDSTGGEWTLFSTEVTDKTGRITYNIPDDRTLTYGMYPVKMVVRGDHTSVDFSLAVVPPRTECVVFSIDGSFTASMSVTGRDPKVRAGAVDIVRHWQELGYLIIYITGRPDMQQARVLSWLSQHNFPHAKRSFADGLSTDPLGHKAVYLKNLIQEHGVIIHAAYGSSKDISVYTSIGLKPKQIFIVGKVSKKHHSQSTVLTEGYAAHLAILMCHGGSRPAQGNARMVLVPRGCFGHNVSIRRRRSAKRTTSFPMSEYSPPASAPAVPNSSSNDKRSEKL
ncbi:hypothetical protein LSTR_LSTR003628 [Laodelphax striatellus]|uniref:DDHD domain-containing protein n=1 Tax=Laodelphax striatellus TaxID=195883 RepID=A0A482XB77_LAOST|nr:hypothetical protein LSTR_LSTR003628 [Laodelphax striatellus]